MTYLIIFAILMTVEKGLHFPSNFTPITLMALYQLKGMAAKNCTTKTKLLWWTVVVMGRRTSPSSYDWNKFDERSDKYQSVFNRKK